MTIVSSRALRDNMTTTTHVASAIVAGGDCR
jgi:hypothetical protein